MAAFVIRAAIVKDISSIVKIRLQTLTNEEIRGFSSPGLSVYTSEERLFHAWDGDNRLKDSFEIFVAEAGEATVGFIVFKMKCDYGYIDNIIVAKEKQGKGIGSALVAYVENITKSKGSYLMKTDTTENVDAVPWKSYNFWIRMGYEDTGDRLPTEYSFKEIPLIKRLK